MDESTRDILKMVAELVASGHVRISDHGYDELVADRILVKDLVEGISRAKAIGVYPDYSKGRCILVLQRDREGNPVHAVGGIPKGETKPAVLVTAYRPDPARWTEDFMERRK